MQDEEENPIRGVTVIIEGNKFSANTETNEDGFFTFENVLSGKAELINKGSNSEKYWL